MKIVGWKEIYKVILDRERKQDLDEHKRLLMESAKVISKEFTVLKI